MPISASERGLCEMLAPVLRSHRDGAPIEICPDGNYLFCSLESFLPQVLREIHDEWCDESLDGIYAQQFQKTGEREIELIGSTLFISDQTLTPIHLKLQLSPEYDRVAWIDLKLGERVAGKCRREPYSSSQSTGIMLHVSERLDSIDWFYHVGFGERES